MHTLNIIDCLDRCYEDGEKGETRFIRQHTRFRLEWLFRRITVPPMTELTTVYRQGFNDGWVAAMHYFEEAEKRRKEGDIK